MNKNSLLKFIHDIAGYVAILGVGVSELSPAADVLGQRAKAAIAITGVVVAALGRAIFKIEALLSKQ